MAYMLDLISSDVSNSSSDHYVAWNSYYDVCQWMFRTSTLILSASPGVLIGDGSSQCRRHQY